MFCPSPCGDAFMQFYMMAEDESVCGGENMVSVCQAGTLCHGAMQNVTNMCTDEDTFFDDDAQEDVKILDILGELSMFCSPCGMAYGDAEWFCVDEDARCDEGGPCQTAVDTMRSTCTDEDILLGMDESESLDDLLGWFGCDSMPGPKCVKIPRQHPIWSSGWKPRECNGMN